MGLLLLRTIRWNRCGRWCVNFLHLGESLLIRALQYAAQVSSPATFLLRQISAVEISQDVGECAVAFCWKNILWNVLCRSAARTSCSVHSGRLFIRYSNTRTCISIFFSIQDEIGVASGKHTGDNRPSSIDRATLLTFPYTRH